VASRSKVWVCGLSLAEFAGSNPAGDIDVCHPVTVVCCAGRGLCDWLITRPWESYRLQCVVRNL
jgi:hypothetical protein